MKKYCIGIFNQVVFGLKRFSRDKVSLFFTFLFPLIFLFVFGSIFNNNSSRFEVAIINYSDSEFAKQFVEGAKKDDSKILKVVDVKDMTDAKERLKRSSLNGILELPANFGEIDQNRHLPSGTIKVLYSKGSEQSGSTLTAIINQIIGSINKSMGHPDPTLKVESSPVGDESLSNFDYTFTGLLIFSLMSMGIFGLANQLPTEKQKGSLRRLRASPCTSGQLIISTAITYIIVSILSVIMMINFGVLVFNFNMRGDWLLAALFIALSSTLTTGFGLLVGSWAVTENQASPLANLISFPMMFLSGTFFPSFLFPEWLQIVSKFIPLTHATDGLRLIMTENASIIDVLPQIGIMLGSIILVYALSVKLFRWE